MAFTGAARCAVLEFFTILLCMFRKARLALAGCTVPQIASITGHSLKDVEVILEANYLGGQAELADQAIVKLVAQYGSCLVCVDEPVFYKTEISVHTLPIAESIVKHRFNPKNRVAILDSKIGHSSPIVFIRPELPDR